MKTAPILLGLLLAAAALASLPSAQAMQAPPIIVCVTEPCPGPVPPPSACTLENVTPGTNPYTTLNIREEVWGTDAGCDIDVEGPDMTCAPPSSTGIDQTVGPVHVDAAVCDGGIPDRICCLVASSAMQPPIYCVMAPCGPCTCPPPVIDLSWCRLEMGTPAPVRTLVWGTDAGCDVDVDTNWYCIYDEIPVDRTVGPLHVSTRICTPDIPPIVTA